jgi:hypothetical protein
MTGAATARGIGLFAISVAILALEVLHVRILSVQMWYYHAYIIVTMAMLGFAVAGTAGSLFPRLLRGDVDGRMAWCSIAFGVCVIAAHLLVPITARDAGSMSVGHGFALAVSYTVLLVPYFFAGMVVTLALAAAADVHGRYFVNLLGSALGAWLFIAAITPLGGERLLVLCAALGPIAALGFGGLRRRWSTAAAVAALALAALLFAAPGVLHIDIASAKRAFAPGRVLEERWTPLSRLDVVQDPERPQAMQILQDGVGGTLMHSDAHWEPRTLLDAHSVVYVPHLRRQKTEGAPAPDVLVIGVGGGSDLRAASEYGVNSVLGLEINEEMTRITGRDYADYNGGIYAMRGVRVLVGEGRSTLQRLDQKFDIIQLAGADTYTAGASGAFVLSEAYLYTMEALADYFDHLKPHGSLGILRFHDEPPRETLRIFGMALLELRRRGIRKPSEHAVVLRNSWTSGTVVSLDPIAEADLVLWENIGLPPAEGGEPPGSALYRPGRADHPAYRELALAVDAGTEEEFFAQYPIDVRPVTDDAPFFFNYHHIWDGADREDSQFAREFGIEFPVAGSILRSLLLQTSLLVAVLVVLPLWWLRRSGLRDAHAGRHLLYFAAVGAAFMFLEISMIQRLVLFLGHPTYSLTVVLFCFLLFAGIGSWGSGRFVRDSARGLRLAILTIVAVGAAYALLLPHVLPALLHLSLPARIACTIALLAPLNLPMGMPFPLMLTRLQRAQPQLVPWAIGTNGGASVIGSVLAVIVAMESGFTAVLWLALLAYLLAGLAGVRSLRAAV